MSKGGIVRKLLPVMIAGYFLSGCIAMPVLDGVDQALKYTRTKVASIAGIESQSQFNETDRIPFAVYCYRTLAQVDCFNRPQAGQESRLVGVGTMKSAYAGTVPYELTTLRLGEEQAQARPAVYQSQNPGEFTPMPHYKPDDIQQKEKPQRLMKFDINGQLYDDENIPDYDELEKMTLQDLEEYY